MNVVALVGRLTKDPIITYTSSQTAVAKFYLAVQRPVKAQGADFPSIAAFGKTAENIEKYVHKGDRVGVVGHIQTSSYDKDGTRYYSTDIITDKIEFLNERGEKVAEITEEGFNKLTDEDIPFED